MNKNNNTTGFPLPKNNFWVGFGSILNIAGSYFDYNDLKSDAEADKLALSSDWNNIGNDIRVAMTKFELEHSDLFLTK